jgi:glutamate carboxypeptidase
MTSIDLPEMLALLEKLVRLDSPTDEPGACAAVMDVLAAEFRGLGAVVERHRDLGGRPVTVARWGSAPGPLLLGHVDTVFGPGESGRRPFTLTGDHARGPGVFDMKAGLVQALFALKDLRRAGPLPALTFLLNADEEIGSPGSQTFIEEAARSASCALVLEPAGDNGALKSARKGIGMYTVETEGVAAHPGLDPEKGVNAVGELAQHITAIAEFASIDVGTTVNVGTVSGGTGRNVVPARASAGFETRFWTTAEGRRVDAAVKALTPRHPRAGIRITGGLHRAPMERTDAVAALVARARKLAAAQGWELTETSVGGVSDGNITSALGVPTLDGLGAEGSGAHTPDEVVNVSAIPRRVRLLSELIGGLG